MQNFKLMSLGRVEQSLLRDVARVAASAEPLRSGDDSARSAQLDAPHKGPRLGGAATELPALQQYLAGLVGERHHELRSAQLYWLEPGETMSRPLAGADAECLCLMLEGQRGLRVRSGEEQVQMRPGELWRVTEGQQLQSDNTSDAACVLLCCELEGALALPAYQRREAGASRWYQHALAG